MNKILTRFTVFLSFFFLVGCATLFGDKTQNLSVNIKGAEELEVTVQDGAGTREATLEDNDVLPITKGTSPVRILVKNDECKNTEIKPARDVTGAFFVNFLGLGSGLLSSATDYVSGKMWHYQNVNIEC